MRRFLFPLLMLAAPAWAEAPRVVTDIAPVHALVARVMEGVGTPEVIVPQGASVHHYAMRPTEARALSEAQVVFWIGHSLAPWLEAPIEAVAGGAEVVELMETDGLHLLGFRDGALFEQDHEDGHDDHGHDHGHDEEGGADPHVWLDPQNGQLFLQVIADVLAQQDPANAESYRRNAAAGQAEIAALSARLKDELAPLSGVPFVVLHDAFHYFEHRFGVEAIGAISASDAATPGAKRIAALRAALPDRDLQCVFTEPQTGARLAQTVTEGLQVRTGELDPLGATLPVGPGLYVALLTLMGESMTTCLKG